MYKKESNSIVAGLEAVFETGLESISLISAGSIKPYFVNVF